MHEENDTGVQPTISVICPQVADQLLNTGKKMQLKGPARTVKIPYDFKLEGSDIVHPAGSTLVEMPNGQTIVLDDMQVAEMFKPARQPRAKVR